MDTLQIALIVALIVSVVIHEMAHGYAADALGDPTARLSGRLTINPLAHLDILGSIIVPGLLIFSNAGFIFGWAKPVPYNPYNFRNQKWGEALVAAAGPAANVVIAIVFAIAIRLSDTLSLTDTFVQLSYSIIVLNLLLTFFNLLPIPPLDGSKILPRLLPFGLRMQYDKFRMVFERQPFLGFALVLFLFLTFLGDPLFTMVSVLAALLVTF
jgi:Zn-dependent protease